MSRFGKLKVVSLKYYSIDQIPRYLVKCDCGSLKAVEVDHLTSGVVTSCGCDAPPNVSQYKTYECRGLSKTLTQWSQEVGINRNTLKSRLRRGWDLEEALFTPVRKKKESLTDIFFGALLRSKTEHLHLPEENQLLQAS